MPELLEITGRHKVLPNKDIKVLRLPVLKGHIGRNNLTLKLEDVQKLFYDAKKKITCERWASAVQHGEAHFSGVNCLDRPELEPFVISASGIDSDDDIDELDGIICSDEGSEDVCSDNPSGTPELLQSPADHVAMSGVSVDVDDEILCGLCTLQDPSISACDATGLVCCDACYLWYHRFCENILEGELC